MDPAQELQDQSLVKPQSEWNRKDKETFLNYEKLIAALGIFFSIVLCTNLFLINSFQENHLVLGFGIVSLILCLANIMFIIWALKYTNKVKTAADSHAEISDSPFTSIVLFVAIIMLVTLTVFYIIFTFAQNDLLQQYSANHQIRQQEEYRDYVSSKIGWIDFLSYANIIGLLLTIGCSFALCGSPISSRLLIYLVGLFLLFAIFYELIQLDVLKATISTSKFKLDQIILDITEAVGIALIIILVLTFLANMKRLRVAYLILGTFFLLCATVQIPATGHLFRQYKGLQDHIKKNCRAEMGGIDAKFLEGKGCPYKYNYATKRSDCEPASFDPSNCFKKPISLCPKASVYQPWEQYLVKDEVNRHLTACLNNNCCGIAANIYGQPLLSLAALSLCVIFLSYILACFCYNLSAKDKGERPLNKTLQIILVALFLIILIIGIFLVSLLSSHKLAHADNIVGKRLYQTIVVDEDATLTHYPHKKYCENFNYFIKGNKDVLDLANKKKYGLTVTSSFDQGLLKIADDFSSATSNQLTINVGTSKIDLNDLFAKLPGTQKPAFNNEDQCSSPSSCKRQGYVVILRTPKKTNNCKNLNANAPVTTVDATTGISTTTITIDNAQPAFLNGYFYFYQEVEKYPLEDVRILETEDIIRLMNLQANAATDITTASTKLAWQDYRYFGLVGNQNAIESILSGPLHVCNYHFSCNTIAQTTAATAAADYNTEYNDMFFRIKVLKVDLVNYGFKEKTKQTILAHSLLQRTLPFKKTSQRVLESISKVQLKSRHEATTSTMNHLQGTAIKDWLSAQNTKFCTKIVPFEVKVYDFETGLPLGNAAVTIYSLLDKTSAYTRPEDYDQFCNRRINEQIAQDEETASIIPREIDSSIVTNENGIAIQEFCFTDLPDNYDQKKATLPLITKTIVIEVFKDGYSDNCRPLRYHANSLEKSKYIDIGLSKKMKEGQARVVLEWSKDIIDLYLWQGTALNLAPNVKEVLDLDLDLHASFGSNGSGAEKFACNIGFSSDECGGVVYNGDSQNKQFGKSSESITMEVIGNYDYLYYVSRYVENFDKRIKDSTGNDDISTHFNKDIFLANPVLKYFTSDNQMIQAVVRLIDLFPKLNPATAITATSPANQYDLDLQKYWPQWQDTTVTPNKLKFDGTSKFYILFMCIRSGLNDKINPNKFKQAKIDVGLAATVTATSNFAFQIQPPTSTLAKPFSATQPPIWSDLLRDATWNPVQANKIQVNIYQDTNSSDYPTSFTPIYRVKDTTDSKIWYACDATDLVNEWFSDFTAVGQNPIAL